MSYRNDLTKSWGAYAKYGASFPDSALALDAIRTTGLSYPDTGSSLGQLAGKQAADGGWPYSASAPAGAQSRLIPTAYNLYTLSRYRALGWGVDGYVSNAVNWLLPKQKADGGFAEDPSASAGNIYETALAWLALEAAKTSGNPTGAGAGAAIDSAQNFLIARQQADGSWSADPFETALALQTLPVVVLADADKDGVPNGVETLIGGDVNVADNRTLARGNGQSVSGVTASALLAEAIIAQPFTHTLNASGGTAPYTFQLISGSLPTGLSLAGNGTISGTPSVAGPFNFSYRVTDAASANSTVAGQIAVINADTEAGIPTLPQWGMILMATLMLASMAQMQRKRTR